MSHLGKAKKRPYSRKTPRIFIKQKVHCKDRQEFTELYMTNLSKGGLFLETPHPPPVGTLMTIGLNLPGSDKEIELVGKVVQIQPFGAGVQFCEISPEHMQVMESFINNQSSHHMTKTTLQGELIHAFDDANFLAPQVFDLTRCSLATILLYVQENHSSGHLRIHRKGEFRSIYLYQGLPFELVSSNLNENYCLGRLLRKTGAISNHALKMSLKSLAKGQQKQGNYLLENGFISEENLQKGLEWQLELKLDEALHWTAGTFSFAEFNIDISQEKVLPQIDLQHLLFRSIFRQAKKRPELDCKLLCNFENHATYAVRRRPKQDRNRRLFKSEAEISMWHHIVHKSPQIEQLVAYSEQHHINPYAFIFALRSANLIKLVHETDEHGTTVDVFAHHLHHSDNYFHRLMLPWTTADKNEITKAKDRLIEIIESNEATNGETPALKAKVEEAYSTLENDFQRRKHRRELIGDDNLQHMADRLLRIGKIKLRQGHSTAAYPLLLSAADMRPAKPEFNQWLEKSKVSAKIR